MRPPLVVGNWKMHGSTASIANLLEDLKAGLTDLDKVTVSVCAPFVYIGQVAASLQGTKVQWGAQNLCDHEQGAYTGEISASMLSDLGCRYVIIGHSERRTLYAEDNRLIAAKYQLAQREGVTPILCVGESLEQREAGDTLSWIEQQLMAVIDAVGAEGLRGAVLAYEPIWAIGTGKTASPEQAQQVHAHIRKVLVAIDDSLAQTIQILYGGSVKADNAKELFEQQDIDGALVGGASLNAEEFAAIVKAAK